MSRVARGRVFVDRGIGVESTSPAPLAHQPRRFVRREFLVKLDGIFEELRRIPQTSYVFTISVAALTALSPWLIAIRSGIGSPPSVGWHPLG
jgi:hypothetical protein